MQHIFAACERESKKHTRNGERESRESVRFKRQRILNRKSVLFCCSAAASRNRREERVIERVFEGKKKEKQECFFDMRLS